LQNFHRLKLGGVCFCFCSRAAIKQATPNSPSGGRVESSRKGLSDMDVARAAMGQGWPFAACPWSGDGAREPRRSRGRMVGCPSLWLLSLGQARESDSPVRGETHPARRRANGRCRVIDSSHKLASPVATLTFPNYAKSQKKPGFGTESGSRPLGVERSARSSALRPLRHLGEYAAPVRLSIGHPRPSSMASLNGFGILLPTLSAYSLRIARRRCRLCSITRASV